MSARPEAERGRTVLHLLSQRPALTGSGVTLDMLVAQADAAGWDQHAVVGVPASDAARHVDALPPERVHPLRFETADLAFPVPGMSDVMPYPSTVFSRMGDANWDAYRTAWLGHLASVKEIVVPDVIHSHHVWLLSALLKEVFPEVPVVTHCHATGLRQLQLCPSRATEIVSGVRRNDAFAVLDTGLGEKLCGVLDVDPDRVHVVGAGYRDDLFHSRGRAAGAGKDLLYVGKLSRAKGLPWLLDACKTLATRRPGTTLHIAGGGAGEEADSLRSRIECTPGVRLHGQLDQAALAALMRRCDVAVLPSFYEGVPLVLVEALACGCRVVATDLPGVRNELAPALGEALVTVPLPRLTDVDHPVADDLPAFVESLEAAIDASLLATTAAASGGLDRFTWGAVFGRVERIWHELLAPA